MTSDEDPGSGDRRRSGDPRVGGARRSDDRLEHWRCEWCSVAVRRAHTVPTAVGTRAPVRARPAVFSVSSRSLRFSVCESPNSASAVEIHRGQTIHGHVGNRSRSRSTIGRGDEHDATGRYRDVRGSADRDGLFCRVRSASRGRTARRRTRRPRRRAGRARVRLARSECRWKHHRQALRAERAAGDGLWRARWQAPSDDQRRGWHLERHRRSAPARHLHLFVQRGRPDGARSAEYEHEDGIRRLRPDLRRGSARQRPSVL